MLCVVRIQLPLCRASIFFFCCPLSGNVLKEICEPAGAVIYADQFALGDPTLSLLELWGAEYQESDAILIDSNQRHLVQSIADRERCPVAFVGEITGDGKVKKKKFSGS